MPTLIIFELCDNSIALAVKQDMIAIHQFDIAMENIAAIFFDIDMVSGLDFFRGVRSLASSSKGLSFCDREFGGDLNHLGRRSRGYISPLVRHRMQTVCVAGDDNAVLSQRDSVVVIDELCCVADDCVFTLSAITKHFEHDGIHIANLSARQEFCTKRLRRIFQIEFLSLFHVNRRIGEFAIANESSPSARLLPRTTYSSRNCNVRSRNNCLRCHQFVRKHAIDARLNSCSRDGTGHEGSICVDRVGASVGITIRLRRETRKPVVALVIILIHQYHIGRVVAVVLVRMLPRVHNRVTCRTGFDIREEVFSEIFIIRMPRCAFMIATDSADIRPTHNTCPLTSIGGAVQLVTSSENRNFQFVAGAVPCAIRSRIAIEL